MDAEAIPADFLFSFRKNRAILLQIADYHRKKNLGKIKNNNN